MALVKTCTKLTSTLLLRNNVKLCIRSKHKEVRDFLYLWHASDKRPSTPEEIKEAAEKYNLHPKEYKLYEKNRCLGDYPKLPYVGAEARDPNYPWDFPALRRNFGEPVHINADHMGEDRYSAGVRELISFPGACLMFFGSVLVYSTFYYLGHKFPWFRTIMEKQYPKPGVNHYTFEPLH